MATVGQIVLIDREIVFGIFFLQADVLFGLPDEINIEMAVDQPAKTIPLLGCGNTDHSSAFKEVFLHSGCIKYQFGHKV